MSRITNDVGQVQRAVSETIGDLARESLRSSASRRCCLLRRAAGARLPDRRAAGRLSAGPARPARAAHDAAQPGGARADVARQRRGVHRPPHRQGVRRRGARGGEVRARVRALYPHQHEGDGALSAAAAADGVIGGVAFVAALWYGSREIAAGRLTTGEFVARSSPRCS